MDRQVAEAGPQPLLEFQTGEQCLQDDQAGERRQPLIFEAQRGNLVSFAVGLGPAILHRAMVSLGMRLFAHRIVPEGTVALKHPTRKWCVTLKHVDHLRDPFQKPTPTLHPA